MKIEIRTPQDFLKGNRPKSDKAVRKHPRYWVIRQEDQAFPGIPGRYTVSNHGQPFDGPDGLKQAKALQREINRSRHPRILREI